MTSFEDHVIVCRRIAIQGNLTPEQCLDRARLWREDGRTGLGAVISQAWEAVAKERGNGEAKTDLSGQPESGE